MDGMTVTLPTGEMATISPNTGPRWLHPMEQYSRHLNCMTVWCHALVLQYDGDLVAPYWKAIRSRLGPLNIMNSAFAMVYEKKNIVALDRSLGSGLRYLEALGLGTKSLYLKDLDAVDKLNPLRLFGDSRTKSRHKMFLTATDYKSSFVDSPLHRLVAATNCKPDR
jgi:hypothetical protein